eukprot:scaffold63541_cov19-Tisochrysis_lutea.AAC.3
MGRIQVHVLRPCIRRVSGMCTSDRKCAPCKDSKFIAKVRIGHGELRVEVIYHLLSQTGRNMKVAVVSVLGMAE